MVAPPDAFAWSAVRQLMLTCVYITCVLLLLPCLHHIRCAGERYRAALQLVPDHPAALLGLGEVLLSSAGQHVAMGATGAAAVELSEAAELAAAAVSGVKAVTLDPAAAAGDTSGQQPARTCATSPTASAAAAAVALLNPSPGGPSAAGGASAAAGSSAAAAAGTPSTAWQVFQYSSNLATAWKLLGDVLLQQHMLQPAAAAAARETSPDGSAAVAAALQGLSTRQGLLAKARRAYAHALMLDPTAGEVWGDVAQCYSHQARLALELQPSTTQQQQQQGPAGAGAGAGGADAVAAARRAAVAMARGGLRLAPASSWLWGVLAGAAAAAGDAAAAEYSYSRALALDPKAAMLWVQLGRLYSRHGSGEGWYYQALVCAYYRYLPSLRAIMPTACSAAGVLVCGVGVGSVARTPAASLACVLLQPTRAPAC